MLPGTIQIQTSFDGGQYISLMFHVWLKVFLGKKYAF